MQARTEAFVSARRQEPRLAARPAPARRLATDRRARRRSTRRPPPSLHARRARRTGRARRSTSGRKTLAAASAASVQDLAAAHGRHAGAEAVAALAHELGGLIRPFHWSNSGMGPKRSPPAVEFETSTPSRGRLVVWRTRRAAQARRRRRRPPKSSAALCGKATAKSTKLRPFAAFADAARTTSPRKAAEPAREGADAFRTRFVFVRLREVSSGFVKRARPRKSSNSLSIRLARPIVRFDFRGATRFSRIDEILLARRKFRLAERRDVLSIV
jgi:hypothetical protein